VTIHGNGAPTAGTAVNKPASITVVSVAGSTSGMTAVYVNPVITSGNSYLYRVGATVNLPDAASTLSDGWTTWDGSDEIAATNGYQICVAEVNASNVVQRAGIATITSAS
jgi:uncharacterized protein YjdB